MKPTYHRPEGLLAEFEIQESPLEDCHKELALKHFRRLTKTLAAEDKDLVGHYTTRESAREHLARLTLVVRDYMSEIAKRQRANSEEEDDDEEDGTIESMIADIVDASLFVSGTQGTFSQPAFVNPLFMGREHELAALIQEISAQGRDDVDALELWDALPISKENYLKVLPDHEPAWDSGMAVMDWPEILLRSRRSEDDISYHTRDKTFTAKEKAVINMRLRTPLDMRLMYHWPPISGEGFLTSRLRTPAETPAKLSDGITTTVNTTHHRHGPAAPYSADLMEAVRRKLLPLPNHLNAAWPPSSNEVPTPGSGETPSLSAPTSPPFSGTPNVQSPPQVRSPPLGPLPFVSPRLAAVREMSSYRTPSLSPLEKARSPLSPLSGARSPLSSVVEEDRSEMPALTLPRPLRSPEGSPPA